jgi:hypothetical protein
LIFLFSITGFAQSTNSLSGIVIDGKTNEPVPFASVFLANTLLGTSTKEDGTFLLEKVPAGRYDVTVSMVGYKLFSTPVSFSESSVEINVSLTQEIIQLKEFVVKSGRSDFDKFYDTFKKLFLGQTPNSKMCTIKNPEDIYLEYDEETKVLKASATEPIQVENKALGYTVFYLLSEFVLDYRADIFKVFGVPRFVSLNSKNAAQERHWLRNRDKAYYGSINHFMRSLLNRELVKNQFAVYGVTSESEKKLDEGTLFLHDSNQFFFKGDMKIVFEGEYEDPTYHMYQNTESQVSKISFNDDSITIYENGYYENVQSIIMNGYFAWRECIGNLLPFNYQPVQK